MPSVVVELEDHVGLRYRVERDVDRRALVECQGDDFGAGLAQPAPEDRTPLAGCRGLHIHSLARGASELRGRAQRTIETGRRNVERELLAQAVESVSDRFAEGDVDAPRPVDVNGQAPTTSAVHVEIDDLDLGHLCREGRFDRRQKLFLPVALTHLHKTKVGD